MPNRSETCQAKCCELTVGGYIQGGLNGIYECISRTPSNPFACVYLPGVSGVAGSPWFGSPVASSSSTIRVCGINHIYIYLYRIILYGTIYGY